MEIKLLDKVIELYGSELYYEDAEQSFFDSYQEVTPEIVEILKDSVKRLEWALTIIEGKQNATTGLAERRKGIRWSATNRYPYENGDNSTYCV